MTMRTRSGTTLLEVLLVLTIVATLLGIAGTGLAGARDQLAVTGACQRLVASLALARSAALMHGGAVLVVDTARSAWQVAPAPYSRAAAADQAGHVRLLLASQDPVIRFDAFGLGRMANRSIIFSRGRAQARLTLSIYGRASRCV
jgi:Tfp pilus assembly protein FimT